MLQRSLCAGILALGTGMSWGDVGIANTVGAGSWPHDHSGSADLAVASVDVSLDPAAADHRNELTFVTRTPSVSNVHIRYAALAVSSDSALARGIDFNGVTFPVSNVVGNDIDLTQVDGVVYAELSDDGASLDIGLALRYLDGAVDMIGANRDSRAEFDGVLPLVFGKARVDVWHELYTAAEVSGVTHDDERIFDARLLIGWASPAGIGIQTGYRSYRLKLAHYDQVVRLDVDVSGPFASIEFRF